MRSIIIGDIHGCDRALSAVLSALDPDPGSDRLILLGDLFDRGPDSREVFSRVRKLRESFGERFILLRGNHEDYLLREKLSVMERLVWERVGRQATVKSFRRYNEKMESAIPWLRENTKYFYKDKDFQCVHAGIMIAPLEANDRYTMIHDHSVVFQNLYAGPLTITGHVAVDAPTWFKGDGKTAVTLPAGEWKPLPEKGVICIDTGCGKGGRLTAMVMEDGLFTLLSVPENGEITA